MFIISVVCLFALTGCFKGNVSNSTPSSNTTSSPATQTPVYHVPTATTADIYPPEPIVYPDVTYRASPPYDVRQVPQLFLKDYDWQWQYPQPQGDFLHCIWGLAADDIYAAAGTGTILHYDGNEWKVLTELKVDLIPDLMSESAYFSIYDIWGSSASNIYAVGGISDMGDSSGFILHYEGSQWSLELYEPLGNFYSISGNSASDIFVIGYGVYHYDGSRWSYMDSGAKFPVSGWEVWAASPSQLFVASNTHNLMHFDGVKWNNLPTSGHINYINSDLRAVWGSKPDDVFFVGESIIQYDGSTCRNMGTPNYSLQSVWGSSHNDVFAGGPHVILHYDGNKWSSMPTDIILGSVSDIWGTASDNVFAVTNNTILHYDGNAWAAMTEYDPVDYRAICGTTSGDLYMVTSDGVYHSSSMLNVDNNRDARQLVYRLDHLTFADIWESASSEIWAVGNYFYYVIPEEVDRFGLIVRYDASSNETTLKRTNASVTSVWGTSSSDVFVVGTGTIHHFDGQNWRDMDSGTEASLRDVWGTSATDVYAVGEDGTILHYDGEVWRTISSGTGEQLNSVWGFSNHDIWAVGNRGTILHYDGSVWSATKLPIFWELNTVWGRAPDDVFAAGQYGNIWHFDGKTWTAMSVPAKVTFSSFWSDSSDVFVFGSGGSVLRLVK